MIIFHILIKLNLDSVCWFHILRHTTMRLGPNKSLPLANIRLFDLRNEGGPNSWRLAPQAQIRKGASSQGLSLCVLQWLATTRFLNSMSERSPA